jgi:hypothetical protein
MTDASRRDTALIDRRSFIGTLAGVAAAAGLPRQAQAAPAGAFTGIQMGPHTILDEGIERTLDLIAGTAAVNAVMPYSHAYNAGLVKPLSARADHGVPLADNARRRFPLVWVRTHEQYYKDTTLRHEAVSAEHEHAGRDLFAELAGPARARGMKVYARILESSAMRRVVANYDKVVTRDVNDQPTNTACWNHPEYIAFWADTIEDLFRSYDLDGLQWGAERMGPLMNVISPWNNDPPSCFCEHCRARGRSAGIDPERARAGYQALHEYVQGQMAGAAHPPEGMFGGFLRQVIRYPEILGWEYQYRLGREAICDAMYRRAESGQAVSGDRLARRSSAFELGSRLPRRDELRRDGAAQRLHQVHRVSQRAVAAHPRLVPAAVPEDDPRRRPARHLARLYYELFGYDKRVEPSLAELGPPRIHARLRVPRDEAERRPARTARPRSTPASASTCPARRPTIRKRSTRRRSRPSPPARTASSSRASTKR